MLNDIIKSKKRNGRFTAIRKDQDCKGDYYEVFSLFKDDVDESELYRELKEAEKQFDRLVKITKYGTPGQSGGSRPGSGRKPGNGESNIFSLETTGVSDYDNLFGKTGDSVANVDKITQKEYYAKHKDLVGEIKYITPDEYLNIVTDSFWEKYPEKDKKILGEDGKEKFIKWFNSSRIRRESVDGIKQLIKEKVDIHLPFIEFYKEGKGISQEGNHRAIAAKELGIKKIPVLFVNERYRK